MNLGDVQLELRDHDAALHSFSRACDLDPTPDALLGRGKALHKKRRFAYALADYDRVLSLDAGSAAARQCRAAAAESRDFEDSIAEHTKHVLDAGAAAELGFAGASRGRFLE